MGEAQEVWANVDESHVTDQPEQNPMLYRTRKAGLSSGLVCMTICAGVLWAVNTVNAQNVTINDQIGRLQTQIDSLSSTNAQLNTRVDTLQDPVRVLQVAKNQLHMQFQPEMKIP